MTVAGQITDERLAELVTNLGKRKRPFGPHIGHYEPDEDCRDAASALTELQERRSAEATPVAWLTDEGLQSLRSRWHATAYAFSSGPAEHPVYASPALTELQHRREAEADDGMSCTCGGGSLVGHASGCPEAAASPSSPSSGVRVTEALKQARKFIADDFGDASDAHDILAALTAALAVRDEGIREGRDHG
jgi:hypothetical protein